jgi:hypothetical protein
MLKDDRKIFVHQRISSKQVEQGGKFDPMTLLPAFSGPARGRRPFRGGLKDNPVPMACWECGKSLVGKRLRFCSNECATAFPVDHLYRRAGASSLFV